MSNPVNGSQRSAKAPPGEVVISPDPVALAKNIVGNVACYVVGLAVLLTVLGVVFRHDLRWGDFPTWVLAISTLLAFVAAAFAGLVAYYLLKVENTRDLKAAEERSLAAAERERVQAERTARLDADRRAQASKVTAYFGRFDVRRESKLVLVWGAIVTNASELPIFDVRIFYYWVNDPGDGSPWTTEQRYASAESIRVIPPGQARNRELPERIRFMEPDWNDQLYLVGIEFTDANSRRWFRDERAALHDRGMAVPGSAQPH